MVTFYPEETSQLNMTFSPILLWCACCNMWYTVTIGAIYLSTSKSVIEEGDTFAINCTVKPLTNALEFFLDGTSQGDCTTPIQNVAAGTCSSGINQNIFTEETILTIASASIFSHQGIWKCTHNGEEDDETISIFNFVTVLTNNQYELPATIKTSSSPNSEFKVFVACGYPQPTISWTLDTCDGTQTGIAVNSPTLTTNTSAGCTSPLVAYTSAIKASALASPTEATCYIPKATMTYTEKTSVMPSSQFTSQVQFPGQSETKKKSEPFTVGSVFNIVKSAVTEAIKRLVYYLLRVLCCLSCKQCCRPFTVIVALALCYYLSRRYVLNGRVVYGIQFAVVAAISQPVTIISAVIVLTIYKEQNESYVTPIMLLQIPLCAFLDVGIYCLWKAYCCQREWTYTEFFKDRLIDCFLSTYGIKFATINKDKIWFKVWAKDDVLLTLFGNNKVPFLYIIMGYGNRNRKFNSKSSRPVVACDDVLGTDNKYRIFYLTCEKHCVTVVRVLNGEEETVLKWPIRNCPEPSDIDHSPLNIGDIRISNYMQDLTKEKESKETAETAETTVTEADAAKTAITITQFGTPGEWIFFISKGDGLHEDDDDSGCSKNLALFLVVFLPVSWIVVPILFIIKLIMHCAKDTRNSKVSSAMIIKNRKDANGKWEEKGQPNAMIAAGDKWIGTDVGKNTPKLPPVGLNKKAGAVPDDTEQTEKKATPKRKQKDSSRNEIQQTQEDTENNTVQTEIV